VLIPILRDYYDAGYLPTPGHPALLPFFPNCNLAVRRRALEDVGGYDESLPATEDVDLCRRVALAGWSLYFEPRASCEHGCRRTVGGLARQWWSYGFASAFVMRKHRRARLEIFLSLRRRPKLATYRRVLALSWFPVPVLLFVSWFALAVLAGILTVLLALLGAALPALLIGAAGGAAILVLAVTEAAGREIRLRDRALAFALTALVDVCCSLGSLAGGLRNRMVYLYPGL
jgi:cellulose synthase/poly-beta-1,6-N-acetylglucosamine synthase-like glycosyltransferase